MPELGNIMGTSMPHYKLEALIHTPFDRKLFLGTKVAALYMCKHLP